MAMIIKENTDYMIHDKKKMVFGGKSRSTEVALSSRNGD